MASGRCLRRTVKAGFIHSGELIVRTISLSLLLLLWTPMASGAIFCVETATELHNALDVAASNGESDIIRIVVGTYEAPEAGFTLNAQTVSVR